MKAPYTLLVTIPNCRKTFSASREFWMIMVLISALFSRGSVQAQNEIWNPATTGTTGVDSFTNGAAWNPTVTYSGATVPFFNSSTFKLQITNNGTGLLGGTDVCTYATGPDGDTAWTNVIGQLAIGGYISITAGASGGNSNAFIMNGGSLTLADTAGNDFSMGSASTASGQNFTSKNYFTMNNGTFNVTNSSGDNIMGWPESSANTATFNGGTANFSTLKLGGRGAGTVNVNGGTVNFIKNTANASSGILWTGRGILTNYTGANGTFNLLAGTVNATNLSAGTCTVVIGGAARNAYLIVSGGTLNANGIMFGTSSNKNGTGYDHNNLLVSGGTINLDSAGIGASGTYSNFMALSGGTFTTLNGDSWSITNMTYFQGTFSNAPGPGIVNFAPSPNATITLNGSIGGSGGMNAAGPGLVVLTGTSTYTGNTMISAGAVLHLNNGALLTSSSIVISGGGTFDVSAAPFAMGSGTTLSNITSTGTINGSFDASLGKVSLNYLAGTPALTVTNGTLNLAPTTTFAVNNNGAPLGLGSYLIISAGSGGTVGGTAPTARVPVSGGGIANNSAATLSIIGNQLYLVVAHAAPTIISQSPTPYVAPFTLFAGASPTYSVVADAQPTTYSWYTNSVLDGVATGSSFTWPNVSVGTISVYCVASNFYGNATSTTWQANVIAAPVASYPSSILADGPVDYWRMNETDDGFSDGNPGAICHDYLGGNDGLYTNTILGQAGYSAISDPTETSACFGNFASVNSLADQIQGIHLAATNGVNAEFSVEALVAITNNTGGGLVAKGFGNGGEEFCLDTGNGSSHSFRFFVRNSSNVVSSAASSISPRTNGIVWYHLVGVCDEANGVVSLYVNGVLAGSGTIAVQSGLESDDAWPMTIGSRAGSQTSGNNAQSFGFINEVALYNYPISAGQVANHYSAAGFPPSFTQQFGTNFNLFAGGSATWFVATAGGLPITYQWYSNNTPLIGATATNYVLNNAQPAGAVLNYYCVASNSVSVTTSAVVTVSILADPTAPYPAAVVAANPLGYWRLNEPNVDSINNGTIANDYWGGHEGIYTNTQLGVSGYTINNTPNTDPTETSANFGNQFQDCDANSINGIDFSSPTNNSSSFSVEAWVNAYPQTKDAGIVSKGTSGAEQFCLDTGSDTIASHGFRFFVRDVSGTTHAASSTVTPANIWSHLVGVCDEANGVITLYVNGVAAATNSITAGSGILTSTRQMIIGSRPSTTSSSSDLQLVGDVDDVAVYNYALTASQVLTQYVAAGVPPYVTQTPPANTNVNATTSLVIPVTVVGTPPLSYQWKELNGNTTIGTGSTTGNALNATLSVGSVPPSWAGDNLQLTVNNPYGSATFNVSLTVNTGVQIVTDLPPQITIVSGRPFTYSIGAIGQPTLTYQWYNGSAPIPGATSPTYSFTSGSPGVYNYSVVVSNLYGPVSSSISVMTVFPQLTNPYATNILQYSPVGYWPLHEVEAPVQGDVELNYGTLGQLANGFYPDWAQNFGSFTRGYAGALAGDSDPAVFFTQKNANSGDVTNALYVPHNSPQATLNPPFSVECWVYPTVTGGTQGDIWSQNGFEGLNAGTSGNGDASVCGIRLYWASGFTVYCYNNSSGLNNIFGNQNISTLNQWYHVVLTCDANTNMSIYTNGIQAGSTVSANGKYSPDYWTPFEVGQGRGNSRAFPKGAVDEVALYTNALSPTVIAQHYSDGTNTAPATSYFYDVTNANPAVYLRMDNVGYSMPSVTTWPAVTNYGYSGINGVYSPGTVPGIMTGPATPGGRTFGGLANVNVAALSGVSSYADVGYSSAFNPTGTVPFSVTAMFRGNPVDNRSQTIVGHTTSSWRLWMNTTGNLEWQIGGKTLGSTGVYNDGNWHQATAVYTPASTPNATGTNSIYVDGVLDNSLSTVGTNGITPGSLANVMIGSDPQYTNYSGSFGLGQQWAGQICEVALFTNSFTASQAQALYNGAQIAPYITGQPFSGRTVYAGTDTYIYFGVLTSGASMNYQWYFNASPGYSGATRVTDNLHYTNSATLQLTVTNLTVADSGYYFVVITNAYGAVTSSLASLTVNPPQAQAALNPTSVMLYSNQLFTYTVSAAGVPPLYYQWYEGASPIMNATNTSYTAVATSGNSYYSCQVSNAFNGLSVTNSGTVTLTGIAWPSGLYAQTVLSNSPVAYWHLDETSGNIAYDYAGGHNGYYTNVQEGVPGYTAAQDFAAMFGSNTVTLTTYPSNSYVGEFDLSGAGTANIDFSQPAGLNAEFSVEAWANAHSGAIVAKGYGNGGEQFCLDFAGGGVYRFFVRNASGAAFNATSTNVPDGNWHHLVGVCDELNGVVRLYVDGVDSGDAIIGLGSGLQVAGAGTGNLGDSRMSIGARTAAHNSSTFGTQTTGSIDEVALYNSALSASQVLAHFTAATSAATPNVISIGNSSTPGQVKIMWNFSGTLQSSTNAAGPYTDVTGATSPYNTPATNTQQFYRVRQ